MPKMTVRVILKSGVEFSIKCDKFTLTRNGFQQVTGYNIEGITENKPVYLDFEQVAAVVRVFADEKPETDGLSQSWDRGGAVFCNPPYGREIGKWVQKAFEEARGGIRLFYLSQRGRIRHIFTITFTGKRKSASCAGGYGSRTTTGTPPIPRPSLQW